MKILFLTRLYYPHVGGIERHIEEISKIFTSQGHSVTVLTTKFESSLKDMENTKWAKIIRFVQPQVKYLGLLNTWYRIFKHRNLIKESDVVHIHDVFIWYWPFKFLFPGKKVFVTFHGQWGSYPVGLSDRLQKKLGTRLADGVITIGEYINKNYNIKSDIVSCGAVWKVKGNSAKQRLLLYVGRLDKNTGLPVFLDLLNWHLIDLKKANYKVLFCGDGELREECEKFGKVLGWQNPAAYYRTAKLLFAPGYLTVLEGLANRCLVFCGYSNPLQKDYYELSPFNKFIVAESDSNKLWIKMRGFINNSTKAQKITEMGYNWAVDQTWDKLVKNYLRLWSSSK